MSESLRSLRWRAAIMIVGAVVVVLYLFASGRGPGYLIQIDYSWGGEFLDSATVVINGDTVGVLQRYGRGAARVTGFEVEAGEHEVVVQREGCEGVPRTVSLSPDAARVAVLIADVDEGYRCQIKLR